MSEKATKEDLRAAIEESEKDEPKKVAFSNEDNMLLTRLANEAATISAKNKESQASNEELEKELQAAEEQRKDLVKYNLKLKKSIMLNTEGHGYAEMEKTITAYHEKLKGMRKKADFSTKQPLNWKEAELKVAEKARVAIAAAEAGEGGVAAPVTPKIDDYLLQKGKGPLAMKQKVDKSIQEEDALLTDTSGGEPTPAPTPSTQEIIEKELKPYSKGLTHLNSLVPSGVSLGESPADTSGGLGGDPTGPKPTPMPPSAPAPSAIHSAPAPSPTKADSAPAPSPTKADSALAPSPTHLKVDNTLAPSLTNLKADQSPPETDEHPSDHPAPADATGVANADIP